ncbi:hypothetical protein PVMG_01327 [Plasmodium vivax Mauritania I]|uniref:SET domain-containing protein n=1 Tax=Plasmodium vivax Mauritania I TaxID=1035515 RepID=A0A0J9TB68_PLAVI|nr:hypothetical protein PVMG_01327 [Plasmodium vivax Mauritania I]
MLHVSLLRDVERRALRRRRDGRPQESSHPTQKDTEELNEIVKELPKLHERNDTEVISALVTSFLERNPKSIPAYESFSRFYLKIGDYKSALNLLYAALYLDHSNEKLASLLRLCEERQVSREARIPAKYKERICYPERRAEVGGESGEMGAKEANLMLHVVLHIFRVLIKVKIDKEYKEKEKHIIKEIFLNESFYDLVRVTQVELFNSLNTLANRIILEFPPSFYLHLKQRELVEFMLIVWQYSLSVRYYSPSSIVKQANPETTFGLAFSPEVAKLHHSCVPTCSFYYDEEGVLTVRALCNIPQGGKLCISVLPDQYTPLNVRKSFRGMARVFSCGCIRCTDATENNLHLRSVKCPRCIVGYICPMKTEALLEALNKESRTGDSLSRRELHDGRDASNDAAKDATNHAANHSANHAADHAERWLCSNCGKLSLQGNKRCVRLERSIRAQYEAAERQYMQGDIIQAKKKLLQIHTEVQYLLHPNHHIMFNVHTLLAGLMRQDPNRELHNSLVFLRKAVIAAENVLPVCSLEKVHLYAHLAHYTFSYSNHCKLYMKTGGVDAESVIEPIFASIWNAVVTTGYNSTLTIMLTQQMRTYAICFNLYSPYHEMEFHINRKEEFSRFYHQVTQKKNESHRKIKKVMKEDPFYPIYMACQCFDIDYRKDTYISRMFKLFKNMQYVGNGQNALSIAASFGNVKLVKVLLKKNYSPFTKNELHMNALLHMASSFLPSEETSHYSKYIPILLQEIESQKLQLDEFEAHYAALLHGGDSPKGGRGGGTSIMPAQRGDSHSYERKNETERPFPFGDLLQDEEFTYGPASRQIDTNQKIILTILLKHLDAKQMCKRRKYRDKLRFNERVNLAAARRRRRDVAHTAYVIHSANAAHGMRSTHALMSAPPPSHVGTTNERGKSTHEEAKTGADESDGTGGSSDYHITAQRRGGDPFISDEHVDSSNSEDLQKGKKKTNPLNHARGRSNSDGSTSPMCSSFDSGKSDDVLNNKVKHYYVQKILTKSISHRLLGFNNALHYACTRGKRQLAKQLIMCGLPVKLLNSEGSTALHMASLSGHDEIVKTILNYHTDVDVMTSHGETPLMLAAYGLHLQVIKTLVAHGAEVFIKNEDNATVLHCLVQGLLRTHTISYNHKAYDDHLAAAPVGAGSYIKGGAPSNAFSSEMSHHLTAHIPLIEELPTDLLILPFKLLHRIKKAITILKLLTMHCPLYLYEVKNANGYNPFEMLKASWRNVSKRQSG